MCIASKHFIKVPVAWNFLCSDMLIRFVDDYIPTGKQEKKETP
jgi:hypothetical protein